MKTKEDILDQMVNELKSKFSGSNDYMSGINDALYTVLRKLQVNRYFLPEGTELMMRIFSFGLQGDVENVKKFMNEYISKYPDNHFNKSFTQMLNGQHPFTKHKEFEKQIPICPDCDRQLCELNDTEWFCDNFECPNENTFKYNGGVLEQEKSPFIKIKLDDMNQVKPDNTNINLTLDITNLSDEQNESIKTASAITYGDVTFVRKNIVGDWMVKFAEKQVNNNKRISATGARLNAENSKTKTDFQTESEIGIIYDTITNSSKAGFYSVYIKDINISDEIKSMLESDGFVVNTNYTRGFEIKWDEKQKINK